MTATLHSLRSDSSANALYPRGLLTDLDFRDNRYPTVSSANASNFKMSQSYKSNFETHKLSISALTPLGQRTQADSQYTQRPSSHQNEPAPDLFSSNTDPSQEPQRTSLSYALPMESSRRVVERYSLDNNNQPLSSRVSNETRPTLIESVQDTQTGRPGTPQPLRVTPTGERTSPTFPTFPSTLRNPSSPPSNSLQNNTTAQFPAIIPLSASPTYTPPVAPNHRAYPQQPTYVTRSITPNPIQTVYTPIPPPQEEVCVECAMRDQDMADVDVTSTGVWERASDAAFEELKARELDDEANGIVTADDPSRPRVRGGRLTEQNVKLWLSINPREPASRQQTLNTYIRSQRTLLEAEALAHTNAMHEAKQLDNRMRDAYSQLRRSAYDMGSSSSPADDLGGIRIKPPHSPTSPTNNAHTRSRSREITLLENGMIVEHVDVRKEEKEARERRRREEKRARKTSRGSVMDASIISAQSNGALAESGLKPYSRYSQASSTRPTSILTAPDRPDLPGAYSQASFSDVHSLSSSSPRRTRFFGIKHLSAGWRSQDSLAPSGVSGSMVDMHVALQREAHGAHLAASPIDLNTPRRSQIWPPTELDDISQSQISSEGKTKKKKGGLAKIWRIVTGSGKSEATHTRDLLQKDVGNDDDLPLAPPPPLSYLVDRGPTDVLHSGNLRHTSTPSLPSVTSAKIGLSSSGMSPPTAPSSILPSPTSLRPAGPDIEVVDSHNTNDRTAHDQDYKFGQDDASGKNQNVIWRPMQPNTPEPETRSQTKADSPWPSLNNSGGARAISFSREKSLPPLPPGELPAQVLPSDFRPRTLYTYDPRQLPPGSRPAHDFLPPQAPFRSADVRRQSFGGISSRPNLPIQTMPISKPVGFDTRRSFGPHYDEFGISRRSLGRLEHVQERPNRTPSPFPITKRKSKFTLSSLLGKKQDKQPMQEDHGQFPTIGYSLYDTQDDVTTNGYAASASRHSAISASTNTPSPNLRMSVTSRKALEELVQQDAEFVAYRYPSNDQRLDFLH